MSESIFSLLWIGLQNLGFRAVNEVQEVRMLGGNHRWWRLRFELGRRYLFDSPYSIVVREGEASGRPHEELIWGETPCGTLFHMLEQVQATPEDVFCDLGCGRGLTVLFAHLGAGLRARGYEILPTFITRARQASIALGLSEDAVSWIQGSFLDADLGDCTIALVSWTTFPTDLRQQVTRKLETLSPGSRIITMTHPVHSESYRLLNKERLRFSWGYGTVYYYKKSA